jgi:Tetracyclin repressor-like, C-terminal domain
LATSPAGAQAPVKSALLRRLANELCGQALSEFGGRAVLNRHRDSARVLAGSPLNGSLGALALMERLIAALEPGIAADRVNVAADTLMAYVTGFVLQEQSGVPDRFPLTLDELATRFPRIFRAVGRDDDHEFATAVVAIIGGFREPGRTASG